MPQSTYDELGKFIGDNNPYGPAEKVRLPDLTEDLVQQGVQIAGWLRDKTSEDPIVSCNHRMTVQEKQQCFYWNTLYPEDPTAEFPNEANVTDDRFCPPAEKRNSAEVAIHQVCKAILVPITYERKGDGKVLDGAILIGFVGSGGH